MCTLLQMLCLDRMEPFFKPPFSSVMSEEALLVCERKRKAMGSWIDGTTLIGFESLNYHTAPSSLTVELLMKFFIMT